jgi:hypothetical protein
MDKRELEKDFQERKKLKLFIIDDSGGVDKFDVWTFPN